MKENVYGHRKKLDYIRRKIVEFADGQPVGSLKVLDFGCGNGTAVSFSLAELGVKLTGIDFHEPSIRYAGAHAPPNARFILGSLDQLDELFDVVICADVIEHLPEPGPVLTQLRKLQRNGGILIGAVPNGRGLFELENKLPRYLNTPRFADYILAMYFKCLKFFGIAPLPDPGVSYVDIPYNADSTHVQFFRLKDLRRLALESGYRMTDTHPGVVLGSPAFSAHFLQYSTTLIRWNTRLSDVLPLQLASTWYFTWQAE